jgi:hypothetical protein
MTTILTKKEAIRIDPETGEVLGEITETPMEPICSQCGKPCEVHFPDVDAVHEISNCCNVPAVVVSDPGTAVVFAKRNLQTFFSPHGCDPVINAVKFVVAERYGDGTFDSATPEGRTAMKRAGRQIASLRSRVSEVKVDYNRALKALPKIVDEEGARFVAAMDAIQQELEAPAKAEAEAEKARVEGHRAAIAVITDLAIDIAGLTSDEIQNAIDQCGQLYADRDFEEQSENAMAARVTTYNALTEALTLAQRREAVEADAKRLAEEVAQLRQQMLINEAADKARREEAERAERQRTADLQRVEREKAEAAQAALRDLERQREQAEREKREAVETERLRFEGIAQAEQDQRDREAAIERQRLADIETERRLEQQRVADAKAEADRLAADRHHRAKVHGDILAAFVAAGVPLECAKLAGNAIVNGKIPNLTINYAGRTQSTTVP